MKTFDKLFENFWIFFFEILWKFYFENFWTNFKNFLKFFEDFWKFFFWIFIFLKTFDYLIFWKPLQKSKKIFEKKYENLSSLKMAIIKTSAFSEIFTFSVFCSFVRNYLIAIFCVNFISDFLKFTRWKIWPNYDTISVSEISTIFMRKFWDLKFFLPDFSY